jgi:CBS domain containing-hemolysin-like protein
MAAEHPEPVSGVESRAETVSADEIEDGPRFFSRLFGLKRAPAQEPSAKPEPGAKRRGARREMIERVIALDEKRVEDVMAPRADIVAVDVETPFDELVRAFAEAGHSRKPIFRGDLDDPIGMVHIKDVMELVAKPEARAGAEPILRRIRRDVLYAPPSMRASDLLLRMQTSRIHMALVIDEYGGTDGLVTIEDLIEEIVGDINDEHDEAEPTIELRPGGGWEADARVELGRLAAETGLSYFSGANEVDTLGGLVVAHAGRVPQRGEVIPHPSGVDFEVVEGDARKIRKLRIRPRTDTSGAATQGPAG